MRLSGRVYRGQSARIPGEMGFPGGWARQQPHPFRWNLPWASEVRLDPRGIAAGGAGDGRLLITPVPA